MEDIEADPHYVVQAAAEVSAQPEDFLPLPPADAIYENPLDDDEVE